MWKQWSGHDGNDKTPIANKNHSDIPTNKLTKLL